MSLLRIRNLRTHIQNGPAVARAVDGVDLAMEAGEAVGLVGESGSGKSVLALSLLGLLPEGARILHGSSVKLDGEEELVGMGGNRLREIRGGEIAMIFQEPMTSLNPVFPIGDQVLEAVNLHRPLRGAVARAEAVRLLHEVGIPDPEDRFRSYPHQLSGGMRQRVMIAMALAGEPRLLVADEPTTALDVTTQAQVLRVLHGARRRRGTALLFISHDLDVVASICDRVVILYGGRVMEVGTTKEVLDNPRHPYTRGLLGSRLTLTDRRQGLRPIPGEVPESTAWPSGCRFHPRCGEAFGRCRVEEPSLLQVGRENGSSEDRSQDPSQDRSQDRKPRRQARCWLFLEGEGA